LAEGGQLLSDDIEIPEQSFLEPWQWMPGNPKTSSAETNGTGPFVVQNHLELKNLRSASDDRI